jgi:hypothetical protein
MFSKKCVQTCTEPEHFSRNMLQVVRTKAQDGCGNILLPSKKNDVLRFKICLKNDVLLNLACVHVYVGMQQSIST